MPVIFTLHSPKCNVWRWSLRDLIVLIPISKLPA